MLWERNMRSSWWHLYKSLGTDKNTFSFSLVLNADIALASLEFTVRPGYPQICSDPLASSCAQSKSHFTTTNHNLWLPASNHVHFTLICPPKPKGHEGGTWKTVKRLEGNVAGTYRQAVCLALLQSCTEGWSMSTSSLLDLKPPNLA